MPRKITYNVDCTTTAYNVDCKITYYGTTEEICNGVVDRGNTETRCYRCNELIDSGKYNKFEISSNNTAASSNFRQGYTTASSNFRQVFFYCDDCMRWTKRKRWIRLRDDQKHYGSYQGDKYGRKN